MRNVLAIMNRELLALFCSPVAYVMLAGFLLITGVLTVATGGFEPGAPATLRNVFAFMPYILALVVPAIAMRTISEEYRAGTIESLMTAPVSDGELVLGKFLAAFCFYATLIAGTLIYLVLMMIYGNPDLGQAVSSYLGLLLAGLFFTSVGVFASSLTRNQIVAWMIAAAPLLLIVWFAAFLNQQLDGAAREVFAQINVQAHLDTFNRGLVTAESVAFFVAIAMLFLFLATKVVESRRWR